MPIKSRRQAPVIEFFRCHRFSSAANPGVGQGALGLGRRLQARQNGVNTLNGVPLPLRRPPAQQGTDSASGRRQRRSLPI